MGKSSGEDESLQASQANLADVMSATGQQSAKEGSTLFNMALPGLEKAESYYGKLASGDPNALARANAPAIQSITGQSNEQLKNIMQNSPRGGARDLAISDAELSKGAQISNLTTGSYTNSFGSLANLGGQNVSQGNQATSTGLQGMNAASNQYGQMQQINNEQKATELGYDTSIEGTLTSGLSSKCWVAAELFDGWYSHETVLIRKYLHDYVSRHWLGKWFDLAYGRYGKFWAKYIKTHRCWRWIALQVFSGFLRHARVVYSVVSKTEVKGRL